MRSLSDNATAAIMVFFLLIAILAGITGIVVGNYYGGLKEQKLATVCMETGGSWTVVNDRSLTKGCVK